MDWIVDVPETFWLFGSGTPPWPSSRDWTANTVWLSIPKERAEGSRNMLIVTKFHNIVGTQRLYVSLKSENMNVVS